MTTTTTLDPAPVNVRIKLAGLWATTMLIVAFVDLFSLYRADIRADIEAGRMSAFTIDQGFLLGATIYVAIPSVMVALSLILPARTVRIATLVVAALFLLTILGGAAGEANYYLLGSALEVAAMIAVIYFAWTWPKAVADVAPAPAAASAALRT